MIGPPDTESTTTLDTGRHAGTVTWRLRVVMAVAAVLFVPNLVIDLLPEPTQLMAGSTTDGGAHFSTRVQLVPGFWTWMIVVGATLGTTGALSWWVGRHSMRFDRFTPPWGRLRDALLALTAMGLGFVLAADQLLDFLKLYDSITACEGPTCEIPSSLQFPAAAEYLLPWVVSIPMMLGFGLRALRSVPPDLHRHQMSTSNQITILLGLAATSAVGLYYLSAYF